MGLLPICNAFSGSDTARELFETRFGFSTKDKK
jgi:hypothetical protein